MFIVLITFTFISISVYDEKNRPSNHFQGIILEIISPFQRAITKGLISLKNVWQHYIYLVHLQEENRLLREIITDLKQERIHLQETEIINQRLKELLAFKESFPDPLLPAMVIGEDISGWFQTILIDRGKRDGIEEGMAVIAPSGVVGQVLESSRHFSRVLLLTDHSSEIAALTQRTRARGIVEGLGDRSCRLKYLHRSEDVSIGDIVLSSGMDRIYQKGLLIGTITHVNKEEYGLFQEAELQPAVNFYELEEVLVILKNPEPSK